jgi:hypothetical protein
MLTDGLCCVLNIVICNKKVNKNTLKIPPHLYPLTQNGGEGRVRGQPVRGDKLEDLEKWLKNL